MITKIATIMLGITAGCYAVPITVPNFSFETATLTLNAGNGPFSQLIPGSSLASASGTLASWTASSTTSSAEAGAFAPTAGGNNWTNTWWQGNNVGYLLLEGAGTAALNGALGVNLNNNETYALAVDIGRRILAGNFNYTVELLAGTTVLASASNLALAHNSSGTDSLTYSSGSSNPLAGSPLSIQFVVTDSGTTLTEAYFDNVRLDGSATTIPEPGALTLVTLGGLFSAIMARKRLT